MAFIFIGTSIIVTVNGVQSIKTGGLLLFRIITFCLYAGQGVAFAQPVAEDSSQLVSYVDKILIKANISSQTDRYILKEHNSPGLRLKANNEYKVFLSLDYEFIGFSYGFSPKLLGANNDNDLKGKSSFTNYRFLFFPGQWLQQVEYNKIRGYYAENTGDFVPGWRKGTDPYLQLSNLKNVQWAMSTAYICNRDFSLKSIVYQTEWQRRSAGSFVPILFYDYSLSSFDMAGIQSAQKEFNIRLGLGYYHTFVIADKFYISPNLVPSLGVRFSRSRSVETGIVTKEHKNYFTRFVEGGIKAGFNSERFVAGGGFNFNFSWYNEDKASVVQNDKFFGLLYFGYRFNAPRLLSNAYEKLSKALNLP